MRSTGGRWMAWVLAGALGGCAVAPGEPLALLWRDTDFVPIAATNEPSPQALADQLLVLSPAMRRHLEEVLRQRLAGSSDPRRALVHALYGDPSLRLDYDDTFTRTPAEAFEQRAGNCLSLVLMTAAFAQALGLPVAYRQPDIAPDVTQASTLTVVRHHVNIALTAARRWRLGGVADDELVVDFVPGFVLGHIRHRSLSEATVVAMFLNNRAAEHLSHGRRAAAYAWARAAIERDPAFLPALNTLAVIYIQAGLTEPAQRVLARVLRADPHDPVALANRQRVRDLAALHDPGARGRALGVAAAADPASLRAR